MDKNAFCDLHTHSCYSDGTFSPAQLMQQAKTVGLAAVALCDHNTVAGLPEFVSAGQQIGVMPVPGVEFSTEYLGTELHLIMLFVKPEDHAAITAMTEDFRKRKEQSNADLVQALQRDGFGISADILTENAAERYINRAHIAAELTRLGYTASVQEAFSKYLAPGAGYYIPPKRPDFLDTVDFIRQLGGVSVLAHPFLNLDPRQLQKLLPEAVRCGLDAMETMYSRYGSYVTGMAKEMAGEFGLLESGGSDFHGLAKPDVHLGTGTGALQVPMDVLLALMQRNSKYGRSL